jgi:hypothetical protein
LRGAFEGAVLAEGECAEPIGEQERRDEGEED